MLVGHSENKMVVIGDNDITLERFHDIAVNGDKVELSSESETRIRASRKKIEDIIAKGDTVYGINTGFGSLSTEKVSGEDLERLQRNLILSHAIGCGNAAPHHIVRGMLLLRLTCICKGHSGVRLEIAHMLVECLNKNYIPYVPVQGTVGASGDLAPLSHLAMGLLGEGDAYSHRLGRYTDAKTVMEELGITPIVLQAKEGLALNNGTQFITSYTAIATYDALRLLELSTLVSALTVEALHGTDIAFDERIHDAKPHTGQIEIAKRLRLLLCPDGEKSDINVKYNGGKVQDAYSLRCIPQVHGPAYDLVKFVENVVVTEMNSANDNPLIFNDGVLSGGNFHGQYIGMAADSLALAMSYLCNISERRLERMVNPSLNGFMPAFLVENAGLNSGLMIVQYAAAGIAAENRQLASPGSVHSIPTCNGTEDIVSMAGHSSRKAETSVDNAYNVLAYELLTAYQAFRFTKEQPHLPLQGLLEYLGQHLPVVENDRYMKKDLDFIITFLKGYHT